MGGGRGGGGAEGGSLLLLLVILGVQNTTGLPEVIKLGQWMIAILLLGDSLENTEKTNMVQKICLFNFYIIYLGSLGHFGPFKRHFQTILEKSVFSPKYKLYHYMNEIFSHQV